MNDDLIAKGLELARTLKHKAEWKEEGKMVAELVSEVKRLKQLIDLTANNFLQLQPEIAWEGGIDEAMKAAVDEIRSCREQLAANDAEICILKTEACAAQKNIKRRDDDINGLMKELARWGQIAIEERARVLYFAHAGDDMYDMACLEESDRLKERHMQHASDELSIQINQESSYLDRLETDYLSWVRAYYRDLGEEVAMQRAQAALEKIRKCHP